MSVGPMVGDDGATEVASVGEAAAGEAPVGEAAAGEASAGSVVAGPWWRQLGAALADIKLAHSVFALPFALLAMFLAAGHAARQPTMAEAGLILLCMVLARTLAMTTNRWADARLDAMNPRTAQRAVPAGRASQTTMLLIAIASGLGFVAGCAGFVLAPGGQVNIWPVVLSPVVLIWLAAYSFTKRFTAWCHLVLGMALALSPIGAAVAIEPSYLQQPIAYLLAGMVLCWVAGFDVVYALQDLSFDRQVGLRSIPASFGVAGAMWMARGLHVVAAGCLIAAGWLSPQLGPLFALAVVGVVALLIAEHVLTAAAGNQFKPMFFTLNGIISLLLGAMGVADVLL